MHLIYWICGLTEGRLIVPSDDVSGGPSTGWPVVLSYGFWKDFYGGAENIIGRKITISDMPMTVVGITPPDFQGMWSGTQIKMYFPLHFLPMALEDPGFTGRTGRKPVWSFGNRQVETTGRIWRG